MPQEDLKDKMLKSLEENGVDVSILKSIPGFFINEDKKIDFVCIKDSIGIPIRNIKREITGIQVRSMINIANKYIWFSSSSYDGASLELPIEFVCPEEDFLKTLFVTEGHFKAYSIAKRFKCPSLSIAGVSSWEHLIPDIKILIEANLVENIYITFDADMCENINVLKATNLFASKLQELFNNINIKIIIWDKKYGKGIDDVIFNKNEEKFIKNDTNKFIENSKKIIDFISEKFNKEMKNMNEKERLHYRKCIKATTNECFKRLFLK